MDLKERGGCHKQVVEAEEVGNFDRRRLNPSVCRPALRVRQARLLGALIADPT